MKHLLLLSIAAISLFSCTTTKKTTIENTSTLINEMYDEYNGKWYKNLTFEQSTKYFENGEFTREEIWHEAMIMPRGLVIKIDDIRDGNGLIFEGDSMFVVRNGDIVHKAKRIHHLLVMGFSVYNDSPESTLSKLVESGVDTSKFISTDKHYLFGAEDGPKIWVEKERLLFTKLEAPTPDGGVSKIEFNKYEPLGNAWIAPEVIFYKNDQVTMTEEYYDIEIPDELSDKIFSIETFTEEAW